MNSRTASPLSSFVAMMINRSQTRLIHRKLSVAKSRAISITEITAKQTGSRLICKWDAAGTGGCRWEMTE